MTAMSCPASCASKCKATLSAHWWIQAWESLHLFCGLRYDKNIDINMRLGRSHRVHPVKVTMSLMLSFFLQNILAEESSCEHYFDFMTRNIYIICWKPRFAGTNTQTYITIFAPGTPCRFAWWLRSVCTFFLVEKELLQWQDDNLSR